MATAIPTILKGDDSGAITISIASGRTYDGATLVVAYQGVTREYTNLVAGGTVQLSFTHDETSAMEAKTAPVLMRLIGATGSEETVGNAEYRIRVTDNLAEVNAGGSFVVTPGTAFVPQTDVGDVASRYTLADLQAKVNEIVRVLAQRSLLAVAAAAMAMGVAASAAADVTIQTARLDALYNDSLVVTNAYGGGGGGETPADYTTTNAVIDIASSAAVTNAGAVAYANAYTNQAPDYTTVSNAAMGAVQYVTDRYGDKTAIIVGSLLDGSVVGKDSFAQGVCVAASGNYSRAEGYFSTASGYCSHAEGNHTTASADYSHVEGLFSTASGNNSHAEGSYASAKDHRSFVWQGVNTTTYYSSHGDGTFNLNPVGGLSGFYIGETNLPYYIEYGFTNAGAVAEAKAYTDARVPTTYLATATLSADEKTLYITNSAGGGIAFAGGGGTDGAAVTNIVNTIFPSNRVFGVDGGLLTAYAVADGGAATNVIWREARGYALTNGVQDVEWKTRGVDGSVTTIAIADATEAAAGVSIDLPSAWDSEARDFAVYIFNAAAVTAPLRLPTDVNIYGYFASATNALSASAVTALYFTEISRGTFLLGRSELVKVQTATEAAE